MEVYSEALEQGLEEGPEVEAQRKFIGLLWHCRPSLPKPKHTGSCLV